jgi:hypothetical protein
VFENRVLRRMFGPKRDEVTGGWRELYNETFHNLYSSLRMVKPRRMRFPGHVARTGDKWDEYSILLEKPEGERPLGKPRRRWKANIKRDL